MAEELRALRHNNQPEVDHYAEVVGTSTQGKEEFGVGFVGDVDNGSVGQDELSFGQTESSGNNSTEYTYLHFQNIVHGQTQLGREV